MKKILFLIHNLGPGGAEKVLVNLVNHLDRHKYDITVMALFGGGVNEQFLDSHIRYKSIFPIMPRGNIHVMKLFSPRMLHRLFIKDHYDIEVSYLEGSTARIISGCPDPDTRLVSWIHIEQKTRRCAARAFRSYKESARAYDRFHQTVCVSGTVRQDMQALYPHLGNMNVLYNTNETDKIRNLALEPVDDPSFRDDEIRLCGMGKLMPNKGFMRIIRIHYKLRKLGYPVHTYLLGDGPERSKIEAYIKKNKLEDTVTLLGYQTNPYKYLAECHLFVCASYAEGFSTAATEALILGVPVCTVEVSGMKEMLGSNNQYGIVTDNDTKALYRAIRSLLDDSRRFALYKHRAAIRGQDFNTHNTVKAVSDFFERI